MLFGGLGAVEQLLDAKILTSAGSWLLFLGFFRLFGFRLFRLVWGLYFGFNVWRFLRFNYFNFVYFGLSRDYDREASLGWFNDHVSYGRRLRLC